MQTDASERGVGAVLSQQSVDGQDHRLAFFSKKLLPREQRYSTVEKECLAIRLGVQAFRVYLLGRPFTIQTDHRALQWLDRLKDMNARLTRWSLALQQFYFSVEHRAGAKNANADGLSRMFRSTKWFWCGRGGKECDRLVYVCYGYSVVYMYVYVVWKDIIMLLCACMI